MATDFSSFTLDPSSKPIPSINALTGILNVAINTSTYVPVTIPAATYCKSFLMQTRDGSPFLLALSASPTNYATINQPLAMDFAGKPAVVICYVKATVAGTLEVILGD